MKFFCFERSKTMQLITNPEAVFANAAILHIFVKPDLKPGDKNYYEVTAERLSEPQLVPTKEQPMGQSAEPGDWIITRDLQRWPLRNDVFMQLYKPVPGKSGFFSPRSVPTPMVELPLGGKIKTSRGEAEGSPGSFLARYGVGDYNVITAKDLAETYVLSSMEVVQRKEHELNLLARIALALVISVFVAVSTWAFGIRVWEGGAFAAYAAILVLFLTRPQVGH
jgi:hypothetical protein